MSQQDDPKVREIKEHLSEILDGTAPASLYDDLADSDEARDLKYDAERAVEAVADAGLDFVPLLKKEDGGEASWEDTVWKRLVAARPELSEGEATGPAASGETARAASSAAADAGGEHEPAPITQPLATQRPGTETGGETETKPDSKQSQPESERAEEDADRAPTTARGLAPASANRESQSVGAPVAETSDPGFATAPTVHHAAVNTDGVAAASAGPTVTSATPAHTPHGAINTQVPAESAIDVVASRPGPTVSDESVDDRRAVTDPKPVNDSKAEPVNDTVELLARIDNAGSAGRKARGADKGSRKRPYWMVAAGAVAAAAAVVVGLQLGTDSKDKDDDTTASASSWSGNVDAVARAGSGEGGVEVCDGTGPDASCEAADEGALFEGGSVVRTDAKTRARLTLEDGTELVLDRSSSLRVADSEAREAELLEGVLAADVAKVDGAEPARFITAQGDVEVLGTKLSITASGDRASVEVVRGEVRLVPAGGGEAMEVRAGEEATLMKGRTPMVASATSMSDLLEWSDASPEDVDAPVLRGLGELRARKPGTEEERKNAVRLTKHAVQVRVVDRIARTTIDETFTNSTNEELEGIFRFPLPPGAQIEQLALEVDGELMQGAFVDRDKGAAIWRGVIQNAAPKAPRPKEEIIWVPGPWRDPALLEWQRGGRFELRIFPIPKQGSRRVVLTYTQVVDQAAGFRRYTYPLAHDPSGSATVDDFSVDVQVLGHDPDLGLATRGYNLSPASGGNGGGERLTMNASQFTPAGDLTVEYALPDRDKEITSWAYRLPDFAKSVNTKAAQAPVTGAPGDAERRANDIVDDDAAYVAIALRPELPRWEEAKERLHVVVVDASRSMVGERFARATRLASSLVREMDRRDRFMVLACDTTCEAMGTDPTQAASLPAVLAPSAGASGDVERFLGHIEPDGDSDLAASVQAAQAAAGIEPNRELRIIYLGDGTPSVGPTKPAHIEVAVRQAVSSSRTAVVAVPLGSDADAESLEALARGGGGVVVPYVPGQRVSAAALSVLSAAYGTVLRDPIVELPPGLTEVSPSTLSPIPAGGERFVVARMSGDRVEGTLRLRGRVGDDSFEQSYPLRVVSTSDPGNAFVPRLFAAHRIAELERVGESERDHVVELSKRFAVASRFTSLIVLESEAMFDAFGLDRKAIAPLFTGELRARGESANAEGEEEGTGGFDKDLLGNLSKNEKSKSAEADGLFGMLDDASAADAELEVRNPFDSGTGQGFGGTSASSPGSASKGMGPMPAPSTAAPPPPPPSATPKPAKKPALSANDPFGQSVAGGDSFWNPPQEPWRDRAPNMVPMRKVFDRKAQFLATSALADQQRAQLGNAEAELTANPNSRDRTMALYKLFATTNRLGEAQELTAQWAQRDALDPAALIARADLAARNGQRDRAIRILGGLADVRPGDADPQERLAELHAAAGQLALACQHRIALANLRASDAEAVAVAVRCARQSGQSDLAQKLVSDVASKTRTQLDALLAKQGVEAAPAAQLSGDLRITATWSGNEDVDVSLIDKNGQRLSWMGSFGRIRASAEGATSVGREVLALAGMPSGFYALEVARANPGSQAPISGSLTIQLVDHQRTVPFTLVGDRLEVGTVQVFFKSRLVPVNSLGWR